MPLFKIKKSRKMVKRFWAEWKGVTDLEKPAIRVLLAGERIISSSIPKNELISIYLKGSFARRELDNKSDVDLVIILKTKKHIRRLIALDKKYEKDYSPKLELKGYALWELKTGKRLKTPATSTPPFRFAKHLEHFKLVYGKDLSEDAFFARDAAIDLKNLMKAFTEIFLPDYEHKKLGFRDIVKQVFWIVDDEERAKGRNPPHNWAELARSIKDRNHIIHTALKYRLEMTKDKKEQAKFIQRVKRHIKSLEKQFGKPFFC